MVLLAVAVTKVVYVKKRMRALFLFSFPSVSFGAPVFQWPPSAGNTVCQPFSYVQTPFSLMREKTRVKQTNDGTARAQFTAVTLIFVTELSILSEKGELADRPVEK